MLSTPMKVKQDFRPNELSFSSDQAKGRKRRRRKRTETGFAEEE